MARAAHPQQPLTAADIMTRNPVVVDSTATVQDVADVMFGTEVRHVPVVEQGTLVGMVSDRDLRSYLLPRPEQIIRPDDARARLAANVGMVMRTDMLTVTPETPVTAIIDLLLQGAHWCCASAAIRLTRIVRYGQLYRRAAGGADVFLGGIVHGLRGAHVVSVTNSAETRCFRSRIILSNIGVRGQGGEAVRPGAAPHGRQCPVF